VRDLDIHKNAAGISPVLDKKGLNAVDWPFLIHFTPAVWALYRFLSVL